MFDKAINVVKVLVYKAAEVILVIFVAEEIEVTGVVADISVVNIDADVAATRAVIGTIVEVFR